MFRHAPPAIILPETCLQLARDCENIIGIKESSGNFENMMKIIRDKPEEFPGDFRQ
ncbi:MAG: dihydrodipicolinate synthase family protein [Marinilabiliales bacterium]|nr:dihydrodipicolinate synthase family protein [Marinilabiliales bacterium]